VQFSAARQCTGTKKRRSPKESPPNFSKLQLRAGHARGGQAEFPPDPPSARPFVVSPPPVVSLFFPKKRSNFFVNPAQITL